MEAAPSKPAAPDPAVTLAVLIGASEFPYCATVSSNSAFRTSAIAMAKYLCAPMPQGFGLPPGNVLSLFDSRELPDEQLLKLGQFLASNPRATDLIIYYVGHGGFAADHEYYLALHRTQTKREYATVLEMRKLAACIRANFRNHRTYVLLDCCFAGEAVKHFQGSTTIEIAHRQFLRAFASSGTALLAAASKDSVALAPPGEDYTRFTGCLLSILDEGIERAGPRLTLAELGEQLVSVMETRYGHEAIRPEVHSPRQDQGNLAQVPLFPNRQAFAASASDDSQIFDVTDAAADESKQGSARARDQPRRRRWLTAAAALAATAIVSTVMTVLMIPGRRASTPVVPHGFLHLTVDPADATILIDGTAVNDPPPLVRRLSAGQHELSAGRRGFHAYQRSFHVDADEITRLSAVMEAAAETGFDLTSDPTGLLVWLDGQPYMVQGDGGFEPGHTPLHAESIAPGAHLIEIDDDEFEPWKQEFVQKPDERPVFHALLARIPRVIVGGQPRPPRSRRRVVAEVKAPEALEPARPAAPKAAADLQLASQVIRRAPTPPPTAVKPAVKQDPGGADKDLHLPGALPARSPPAVSFPLVKLAPEPKRCLITINTRPSAEVAIDGKPTGVSTPLVGREVTCGAHQLTFKNSFAGIDASYPMYVHPGETWSRTINLDDSAASTSDRVPTVAVLALESIDTPEALADVLTAALKRSLERDGRYRLVQGRDLVEVKLVFSCPDEAPVCMRQAGRSLGASALVFGTIRGSDDQTALVKLKWLDVATGGLSMNAERIELGSRTAARTVWARLDAEAPHWLDSLRGRQPRP